MDNHNLFSHSLIVEYLGCFSSYKEAAINIWTHFLCAQIHLFLLDKYPGVELLGHMVDV